MLKNDRKKYHGNKEDKTLDPGEQIISDKQ